MTKKITKKLEKKTSSVSSKKVAPKKPAKKVVKKNGAKDKLKATAKRVVKKVTVRRASTKTKQPLVISTTETAFYAKNGAILTSLLDLYAELSTMQEEEFSFHCDPGSNHFSNWIRDILSDEECATELSKVDTKRKARTVLKRHLDKYSY